MSLARAIETGDLAELPSRRDEDWHWTDLRGLIRAIPAPSPAFEGDLPAGRFDADAEVRIVNGRGPRRIVAAAGETQTIALRFIAATRRNRPRLQDQPADRRRGAGDPVRDL